MRKQGRGQGPLKRLAALLLSVLLLTTAIPKASAASQVPRSFSLAQAQSMALSSNSKFTKQNNQIILKRMKYVEAVKGAKAKAKNLRTFRWTPLLSFKFPQPLDITMEYDLNIKPLVLQTEIETMKHQLQDIRYEILQDVNSRFYNAYLLQEKSAFTQERLEAAQERLERNQARLVTGNAMQADVDKAKSSVDKLTKELSNQLRELTKAKEKLGDLVHTDISVGYKLVNPFKSAAVPREKLDWLIRFALQNDQLYYEAKAAASTAKLNLEAYENLMRNQYGGKMNRIQGYINQAKQGADVDYSAFQMSYNEMLKEMDKPWDGTRRIIFFKFSKEWFKGAIDGTRYIEDEMYAVYTACMEYGSAKKEQESVEKELRTNIKDSYELMVTGYKTWKDLQELAEKAQESLERTRAMNQLGKATFSEVEDELAAYEQAQQDTLEALKEYNDSINTLDRMTCGAVSQFLKGASAELDTGEGGDSFAILDPINDPYYYIYTSVADMTFHVGVSIPEDFTPTIDAFEVWVDNTRIGSRTTVGDELRHLALDYGGEKLRIRLFSGSAFVDECEIDPDVPRDRLDIKQGKKAPTVRVVGTYSVKTAMQGRVSMSELKLTVNASEGAVGYTLSYGENGIYTTEVKALTESFSYLTLMMKSLGDVTATLYDKAGEPMMKLRFDTENMELITIPDSDE